VQAFRAGLNDASWPELVAVLITVAILLYALGRVSGHKSWSRGAKIGVFSLLALLAFTVFAAVILYIG
jgi:hypothetical protein